MFKGVNLILNEIKGNENFVGMNSSMTNTAAEEDEVLRRRMIHLGIIAAASEYYPPIEKYISQSGLNFKFNDCMPIEEMEKNLRTTIPKVGNCTLNDRKNNPVQYKKDGEPKKSKEIINGENYEGVLVKFNGVTDKLWKKKDTEGIYFITINGYIVKIGMTENNFCDRFNSYICGSRRAMVKGTCSTTNFIICETLFAALLLGLNVDIYGIQLPKEKKEIEIYGKKITCPVSVVRAHEEIITNIYKSVIGKIPPLCVQHACNTN